MLPPSTSFFFFFFNDTATTEIYTLSLHDALPICLGDCDKCLRPIPTQKVRKRTITRWQRLLKRDRKSTRLNSSHGYISYAVFCLKKKKNNEWIAHVVPPINCSRRSSFHCAISRAL